MILVLGYFEDTLANVGLPEACWEQAYNEVTQIENKCIKCEWNQIEKKLSQIKSKTVSRVESKTVSRIKSKIESSQKRRVKLSWKWWPERNF